MTASQFAAAWNMAAPVITRADCYPDAAAWLNRRGIDPMAVERRSLARILPDPTRLGRELGGTIPGWMSCGWRSWARAAHCIVAPVLDEHGGAVALRAPSCGTLDLRAPVPAIYSGAGVHASPRGRALLMGEAVDGDVVIVDTIAELLAWSMRDAVTALASWPGGWTRAIADRIPSESQVIVRVSGELAEDIRSSLVPRCRVVRPQARRVA